MPASITITPFPAGPPFGGDHGVDYDGVSKIWFANPSNDRAAYVVTPSGAFGGSFPGGGSGGFASWIAVNLANRDVWLTESAANLVARFDTTGALIAGYAAGTFPTAIRYHAGFMWIATQDSSNNLYVMKFDALSGASITYPVFPATPGYRFAQIWIQSGIVWCLLQDAAPPFFSTLVQISEATGAVLNTFSLTYEGLGITGDGTNIWITDFVGNMVNVYNAAGTLLNTFSAGGSGNPQYLAFDGTYMWIVNQTGKDVSVLTLAGALVVNQGTGIVSPTAMAFDGTYMWLTDQNATNILQMLLTGVGPAVSGRVHGTFVGSMLPGQFGGGTK